MCPPAAVLDRCISKQALLHTKRRLAAIEDGLEREPAMQSTRRFLLD
jgi:hypothetical protein